MKGDDIVKKIKFYKLSQMKQIVIKRIKINSKGRINEGKGCFQILEGQHINQGREREKGGKKKKLAVPNQRAI